MCDEHFDLLGPTNTRGLRQTSVTVGAVAKGRNRFASFVCQDSRLTLFAAVILTFSSTRTISDCSIQTPNQ